MSENVPDNVSEFLALGDARPPLRFYPTDELMAALADIALHNQNTVEDIVAARITEWADKLRPEVQMTLGEEFERIDRDITENTTRENEI